MSELAGSGYISVRVALAESMHQLAALVGQEAVQADLLPVIQVVMGLLVLCCFEGQTWLPVAL